MKTVTSDAKKAYMRAWYQANRASEIKRASERKKKRLAGMTEIERMANRILERRDWLVEKLRRDIRKTYDPAYLESCKVKKRIYEKGYQERLKQDPARLDKWKARHAARVRGYRERKKRGELRQSKAFEPIAARVIPEKSDDKIKKSRLPRLPKGFKAAQTLAKIITSNLTNETK
jgi:hypothetical protein